MTPITLTPEQLTAKEAAQEYVDINSPIDRTSTGNVNYLSIGGYAGTGKTTMIRSIREEFPKETIFHYMSFTGKAAMRIKQTLGDKYFYNYPADMCSTIHQAIYRVRRDAAGRFYGFDFDSSKTYQNVIIVDEASMVPQSIYNDLMRKNVPIIFIGDHGQLPPITPRGEDPFNLMQDPMFKLNTIHRNADGIKHFATDIRLGNDELTSNKSYDNVQKYPHKKLDLSDHDPKKDIILVGGNYTRVGINQRIKRDLGFNQVVEPGLKVIALRNNWRCAPAIFNGQIFTIKDVIAQEEEKYVLDLVDDTGEIYENVDVAKYAFNKARPYAPKSKILTTRDGKPRYIPYTPFDYAYAITCHKSQGSEWDKVIVVNESQMFNRDGVDDSVRWLYTAVTRAAKELTVYNF